MIQPTGFNVIVGGGKYFCHAMWNTSATTTATNARKKYIFHMEYNCHECTNKIHSCIRGKNLRQKFVTKNCGNKFNEQNRFRTIRAIFFP